MPHALDAQARLHQLNKALDSGTFVKVRQMLNGMSPAEIAHLLESVPPDARTILWRLVNTETEGEVLQHLNDEILKQITKKMNTQELTRVLEGLDTDDLADILQTLPKTVTRQVLNSLDSMNRKRLEAVFE
ncbi:MAG: magnesium transporter, partial [Gammaproteobacteria bacterium]|nr:magnesium transporter [Gammaproteobacteria bacterium]